MPQPRDLIGDEIQEAVGNDQDAQEFQEVGENDQPAQYVHGIDEKSIVDERVEDLNPVSFTGEPDSNEAETEPTGGTADKCPCDICPDRSKVIELKQALDILQTKFDTLLEKSIADEREFKRTVAQGDAVARAENFFLKERVETLEKELATAKCKLSFNQIEGDDELISHYTGLPNKATFDLLCSMFNDLEINYYAGWRVVNISRSDQIFITLMKLRRNFTHLDLSTRFGVSEATISNVAMTWIHAVHYVLVGAENSLLSNIPSRHKNQKDLPQCFKDYPDTRLVIDCTEVRTADPKLLDKHNKMFSPYKHFITGKGLVAIAPNGTVVYASELYPGRTSDKEIVRHCKILDKVEGGDSIMADKGFLISSMLPAGVTINMPPFKEVPQFTPEQIEKGYGIAQARVHVERAIQRIKLFHILDYIPQYYLHVASKCFQVCAALTNFRRALIKDNLADTA